MDAVLAVLKLLGTTPEIQDHPIFSQEQIAHAAKLGLGVSSPEQIEIVTADAESALYADKLCQILSRADVMRAAGWDSPACSIDPGAVLPATDRGVRFPPSSRPSNRRRPQGAENRLFPQ